MQLSRTYSCLAFLLSSLFLCCTGSFAQVVAGFPVLGTFDTSGFDTVNIANLNIHLSYPVVSKPGRGISFDYNLGYDGSQSRSAREDPQVRHDDDVGDRTGLLRRSPDE